MVEKQCDLARISQGQQTKQRSESTPSTIFRFWAHLGLGTQSNLLIRTVYLRKLKRTTVDRANLTASLSRIPLSGLIPRFSLCTDPMYGSVPCLEPLTHIPSGFKLHRDHSHHRTSQYLFVHWQANLAQSSFATAQQDGLDPREKSITAQASLPSCRYQAHESLRYEVF